MYDARSSGGPKLITRLTLQQSIPMPKAIVQIRIRRGDFIVQKEEIMLSFTSLSTYGGTCRLIEIETSLDHLLIQEYLDQGSL